jgi:hypothetical protein
MTQQVAVVVEVVKVSQVNVFVDAKVESTTEYYKQSKNGNSSVPSTHIFKYKAKPNSPVNKVFRPFL